MTGLHTYKRLHGMDVSAKHHLQPKPRNGLREVILCAVVLVIGAVILLAPVWLP
jgi:hypothetical protein